MHTTHITDNIVARKNTQQNPHAKINEIKFRWLSDMWLLIRINQFSENPYSIDAHFECFAMFHSLSQSICFFFSSCIFVKLVQYRWLYEHWAASLDA